MSSLELRQKDLMAPRVVRAKHAVASTLASFLLLSGGYVQAQTTLNVAFDVLGQIDGDKAPAWLAVLGRTTGAVKVATDQVLFVVDGNNYRIDSTATGPSLLGKLIERMNIKAIGSLQVTRRSEGAWGPGGQASTRFWEKRGGGESASAVLDYRAGIAAFSRGDKVTSSEPLRRVTSDTLALPFAFCKRPAPKGPVSLAYTHGRRLKAVVFDGSAPVAHAVGGVSVLAVRYVARRPGPRDPEIEIWVREADGFPVRVRIGLSAKWGVRAEANLVALPPLTSQK